MAVSMSKELLIRVPAPLYRRIKEVCAHEYKSMSAFVRELIKEKVDEMLSLMTWKIFAPHVKILRTVKYFRDL